MFTKRHAAVAAVLVLTGAAAASAAVAGLDWGQHVRRDLASESSDLFGVGRPLDASSTVSADPAVAAVDPTVLVTVAKGLKVRVVTKGVAGPNIDQMALWPSDEKPDYLIACNEQGATQPGLQRINIATGATETILTGTTSCDPVRRTPWGSILFGEEAGGTGHLLELVDPLHTTGVLYDRTTGALTGTDAANVVVRNSVGTLSYESLALYRSGVLYYGDENRPAQGTQGGAYFKFVPATPWDGVTQLTTAAELSKSPLASGSIYGLRLGLHGGATDYGQGTNTGFGAWVPVCAGAACNALNLRNQTTLLKLTGYYRPEDADIDRGAEAAGNVRFCANNTGNEFDGHTWGETVCITDGTLDQALANTAKPELQYFVVNSSDMAMTDNIAFQPRQGNWLIVEDSDVSLTHKNNDMFLCLPDGADPDDQSDGCVKIGTLNDLLGPDGAEGAEWTGPIFDASGKKLYVSVQHNMTGAGVVLEISGFKNDD